MRPLRVLAVTDFYHPRAGGVERVVRETARRMAAAGVAVEILTRRLDPGAAACCELDGIPVHRIGRGPAPLPWELAGLYDEGRRWAAVHLERFDVVHAHLSFVAQPLLAPLRVLGVPLVATFYGPWHREYLRELGDPAVPSRWPRPLRSAALPWVSAALRRAQRRVLRYATERIVLSEQSRRELREEIGAAADLAEKIPGGVDLDRFTDLGQVAARRRLTLGQLSGPLLLSVRRLVPRMGLDNLIDAVAGLAKERPGLTLAIAGTGAMRAVLEERAQAAGLGERVRFLGFVADDQLPDWYAAADLVVIPTLALEGFGLPVLEAWASAVPVVATPVGALAETVGQLDPGLLAKDTTPAAIAAAIRYGLEHATADLGERARSHALSYSWQNVTARYTEVYHRSTKRRPTL